MLIQSTCFSTVDPSESSPASVKHSGHVCSLLLAVATPLFILHNIYQVYHFYTKGYPSPQYISLKHLCNKSQCSPLRFWKQIRETKSASFWKFPQTQVPLQNLHSDKVRLQAAFQAKPLSLFFFLNYIILNLILFTVDNVLIFQLDPSVPQQGTDFCNTCTVSRLSSRGNNELRKRSLDLT